MADIFVALWAVDGSTIEPVKVGWAMDGSTVEPVKVGWAVDGSTVEPVKVGWAVDGSTLEPVKVGWVVDGSTLEPVKVACEDGHGSKVTSQDAEENVRGFCHSSSITFSVKVPRSRSKSGNACYHSVQTVLSSKRSNSLVRYTDP